MYDMMIYIYINGRVIPLISSQVEKKKTETKSKKRDARAAQEENDGLEEEGLATAWDVLGFLKQKYGVLTMRNRD
jgi:hypothetical protein